VCEAQGWAVRCRGRGQRCCSVSGSEDTSGRTWKVKRENSSTVTTATKRRRNNKRGHGGQRREALWSSETKRKKRNKVNEAIKSKGGDLYCAWNSSCTKDAGGGSGDPSGSFGSSTGGWGTGSDVISTHQHLIHLAATSVPSQLHHPASVS